MVPMILMIFIQDVKKGIQNYPCGCFHETLHQESAKEWNFLTITISMNILWQLPAFIREAPALLSTH